MPPLRLYAVPLALTLTLTLTLSLTLPLTLTPTEQGCLNKYLAEVVRLVAASPKRQLSVGQIAQQRPCPAEFRQGSKFKKLLLRCPQLVLKGKDTIAVAEAKLPKSAPVQNRAIADSRAHSTTKLPKSVPVQNRTIADSRAHSTTKLPKSVPVQNRAIADSRAHATTMLRSISAHYTFSEPTDDRVEISQPLTSVPPSHRRTTHPDYQYVQTQPQLLDFARQCVVQRPPTRRLVAFDCEGLRHRTDNSKISLIQLSIESQGVWILDVQLLGELSVLPIVKMMFEDPNNIFLCHDVHADAVALNSIMQINPVTLLDAQLACEYITDQPFYGFSNMLELFDGPKHHLKMATQANMNSDPTFWNARPLSTTALRYAASDVHLMMEVAPCILQRLEEKTALGIVFEASMRRYTFSSSRGQVARSIYFDSRKDYQLGSHELHISNLKTDETMNDQISDIQVVCDLNDLLALVPDVFKGEQILGGQNGTDLIEIVLDKGRRPCARFRTLRNVYLVRDGSVVVTDDHLREIVTKIGEDRFGPDNRAGLDASLHRISAMRNKRDQIYALTMRVGRAFYGNANAIQDMLFCSTHLSKSILILGPPGSGKTTVIREIARKLSSSNSVCIIDTSNEICGDGEVPHPCVGRARRMMVKHIDLQSHVMIECVQNHTPDVLIVDEIGRPQEVEAARTCKQRGVRMIASAHGNLRSLVKNRQLNGLVGGLATVTIGDQAASKNHGSKIREQRETDPIFDVVVEVESGKFNEFTIIDHVANAVDCILAGKHVKAQQRVQEWDNREDGQGPVLTMRFNERT